MTDANNIHGTTIQLAGKGVLITGRSGTGKTSLGIELLEFAKLSGIQAAFVCDDQTLVELIDEDLIAAAPPIIEGKIELFGYGIVKLPHKKSTVIDLVVELNEEAKLERMPQPQTAMILDAKIPLIQVPARNQVASRRLVFATLGLLQQTLLAT